MSPCMDRSRFASTSSRTLALALMAAVLGAGCASTAPQYRWAPISEADAQGPAAVASSSGAADSDRPSAVATPTSSTADAATGDLAGWLDGPAGVIATADERWEFGLLKTREGRLAFIERFWDRRDHTRADGVNERRQEFERRVATANRVFGGGDEPGWSTAFGITLLVVGYPYSATVARGDHSERHVGSLALPEGARDGDRVTWDYIPPGTVDRSRAVSFFHSGGAWRLVCGPIGAAATYRRGGGGGRGGTVGPTPRSSDQSTSGVGSSNLDGPYGSAAFNSGGSGGIYGRYPMLAYWDRMMIPGTGIGGNCDDLWAYHLSYWH